VVLSLATCAHHVVLGLEGKRHEACGARTGRLPVHSAVLGLEGKA